MTLEIRPGSPCDVRALIGAGCPAPQNVDDLDERSVVLLAWDNDRPVGYAALSRHLHGQPLHPEEFFLHVAVRPADRRRGAGGQLFRQALAGVWPSANRIAASVAPGDPASLAFAAGCGFRVDYEMYESVLDLSEFDAACWQGAIDAVRAAGVRLPSLAEIANPAAILPAVYELDRESSGDIPQWAGYMPPFERYARELMETPDGVILAYVGEDLAGMAVSVAEENGTTGYSSYLGVSRRYRQHGIGLALKLRSIEWAQGRGLTRLRTHNNAASAPIIALNRKLGCELRPDALYLIAERSVIATDRR